MSALDRKLGRDLWRLKGQVATIGLVLACGVMAMIMMRSTWQSLLEARDAYYARFRFGDVFAHLERAPDAVLGRLARVPGVALAYARVVEDVMVPMADEPDPIAGRMISIPDAGEPPLGALYLRAGRLPAAGAPDEVVVLAQFADSHHLAPGDAIPAVINGRLRTLAIVGVALSPEYVLAISGREMIADNRRFVVLWMRRAALAPAFRMVGAFNDVVLRLAPGASPAGVRAAVDRELAPHGGSHAVDRARQTSNYALHNELAILRMLAVMLPAIFLSVAAFLVNVVVSRLVFLERTEIAVLKALGFTDRRIARHYLVLVALIVAIGSVVGIALGVWSGTWMTNLYSEFYRFPTRIYHVSGALVALTCVIGLAAASAGALLAVYRITRMAPAEAMRPPAPLAYRRSRLERLGLRRVLGPTGMMVAREIERRPLRFAMSTLGIAMGLAIFVMGRFSWDSFDFLMSDVFVREHQEDLTVSVARALPARALHELAHVPGVRFVEGQRAVAVRFRAGARQRDAAIIGMPVEPELRHQLDDGTRPVRLPERGLVMTDKLAELLGLAVGDLVDVDILEGDYPTRQLPLAGVIREAFGLQAYARADWLAQVLREQPRVSLLLLRVDRDRSDDVRARLRSFPAVLGVTRTQHITDLYRAQTGRSMLVMTLILTLSAAAIAIGVFYNNARIALSLRARDLASLRVLGFTRLEISRILLGELAVQVGLGIPLGLAIGTWWSRWFAAAIDPEAIRFPVHIAAHTYASAALIGLVAATVSALLVRRKLDHLDLIAVLKSSE
ncbi:MAG TPA: FtsX-like permease family protein [Kofleriaceae bacterium]|nr:FtsX-like permease family protein [Kofleriaceae bacterium]